MASSKYKLTYFNVKGVVEGVRFIFAYADVDFEDNRIKRADWPALKSQQEFGVLPVLEVDGKVMNQSIAMCRYLGKRFGLVSEDSWTNAMLDALVDNIRDTLNKLIATFVNKTPETEKIAADSLTFLLGKLENLATNGYFYEKITWVDLYFAGFIETLRGHKIDVLNDYPNLTKLVDSILNHPNVKKYIEARPVEEPRPQ